MPLVKRNWLVVLAANHPVLCGDQSQWEALLGGGYKSTLNPMTQQVGCVWDDTLQRFKGPALRRSDQAEKHTFRIRPSIHPLHPLVQITKVCGPGCSAGLLVKAVQSPKCFTDLNSLKACYLTKLWLGHTVHWSATAREKKQKNTDESRSPCYNAADSWDTLAPNRLAHVSHFNITSNCPPIFFTYESVHDAAEPQTPPPSPTTPYIRPKQSRDNFPR